jgi:hypothetical protein
MEMHWNANLFFLTIKEPFGKSGSVFITRLSTKHAGLSMYSPIRWLTFLGLHKKKESRSFSTPAITDSTRDSSLSNTNQTHSRETPALLTFLKNPSTLKDFSPSSPSKPASLSLSMTGHFRLQWSRNIGKKKNSPWSNSGNSSILELDSTSSSLPSNLTCTFVSRTDPPRISSFWWLAIMKVSVYGK